MNVQKSCSGQHQKAVKWFVKQTRWLV